ncbi:MAG: hypothetical protein ABI091_14910 [Ferruginibacter sp.]
MSDSELCVNLWFVVDIGTNHCYNWLGRVYDIEGDDSAKTKLLKQLAEHDFNTVPRNSFPEQWKVILGHQTYDGNLLASYINTFLDAQMEYFISSLESNLPKQIVFNTSPAGGESILKKIPNEPLFVSTILMENEVGELFPNTTDNNKALIALERQRIENLKQKQ